MLQTSRIQHVSQVVAIADQHLGSQWGQLYAWPEQRALQASSQKRSCVTAQSCNTWIPFDDLPADASKQLSESAVHGNCSGSDMPGQLWNLHAPDCEDRLLLVSEPDQLVPQLSNSVLHVLKSLMAQMGAFGPDEFRERSAISPP